MSLLMLLTAAVATGGLLGGGWAASSHPEDAQGVQTTHALQAGSFFLCASATCCAALIIEWVTQRQLRLVRSGGYARTIIREVRSKGERGRVAVYDFVAEDGQSFSGRVPLNPYNGLSLNAGVPVAIFYDRKNPDRNSVVDLLWCVEWTEAEEASIPAPRQAA